jgi:hypothetical protein
MQKGKMMAKYVNADGVKTAIEYVRWTNDLISKDAALNLVKIAIEEAPTETVDAIDIVRCAECWLYPTCRRYGDDLKEDDYCSRGKREGANDG